MIVCIDSEISERLCIEPERLKTPGLRIMHAEVRSLKGRHTTQRSHRCTAGSP